MSETPKCPGCGADMKLIRLCKDAFCYTCTKCDWDSPTEVDAEAALRMAMRRAEPKNRVLTLEEVVRSDAMWYEDRTMQGTRVVILGYAQNEPGFTKLINYLGDKFYRRDDAYNDFWRCWLHKPTKEEMERTPWEGDNHE